MSIPIRKNVAHVSDIERNKLRNAILAINNEQYPDGVSFWHKQDGIHQATHVHGGPAFLPWHRELINRFEALLQGVDPTVALHYWDWTTDPRASSDGAGGAVNLFSTGSTGFMGSASGNAGPPIEALSPPAITRNVANGASPPQLPGVQSDSAIINSSDGLPQNDQYQTFRQSLEGSHNTTHGYIGGSIGNPHTAFEDPFVFLLHSNVDRLFAMWQTVAGQNWRLDPTQVYGSEGNSPTITEYLQPWAGGKSLQPWVPPSPDITKKNSKDPSVVAPPVYDTTNCVNIMSAQFPGVYLRMDGNGVTGPTEPGGGTVNCQGYPGPWEKFRIEPQNDGTVAIASVQFPNVYLRMDGNGVTGPIGPGGGIVNCQGYVGSWEKFRIEPQNDGTVAIASVQFPNVYLRMDGNGVTGPTGPGGGTVNCQGYLGSWEKFRIAGQQV